MGRVPLAILGAHENIVVSEIALGPHGDGPGAHVHHHHSDAFYVLEGELTVRLGDGERPLAAGGFVRIPPNVVHTVRNASGAPVRMLNIHAPGMGFDDYVRAGIEGDHEARARFDQHPPPEDGGRPAEDAAVFEPGESDDAGGAFSLREVTAAPGDPTAAAEARRTAAEGLYVLEGTLWLHIGDATVAAGPGTFVLMPPGTAHTFSNPGLEPARFVSLTAPAG